MYNQNANFETHKFVYFFSNLKKTLHKQSSFTKKLLILEKPTCKMTLEEAQELVDEWIKTIGVRYYNELTNTAILMEEVGEVARIMARTYGEQSFKEGEKHNLADEMADVLFVLICLANQTGVSLTEALKKNLDKKTNRDKERHKNNPKLQ
ncbi:MAG: nucleotide pyrophosphohydrolase [Cytophagales bacterium]|nr:nucleotide pyrophosphohydrolase [Cytophagales bacterium]